METLRNLLIFVFLLAGLVAIHELGHLVAAILCRVKVKEFGIGLPPRLLKLGEWRGMAITLNLVPLGGFVRPAGEFDPTVPNGLAASPAWARILVFAAGPLANFILGYFVFTAGFMTGWPDQVTVVSTLPGYPAEAAGLLPDDVILSANGQALRDSSQLTTILYANLGKPIELQVKRGSETLTLSMTPRANIAADERPVGLNTSNTYASQPLPVALLRAGEQVVIQIRETFGLPLRVLNRETKVEEVRFSGVVGLKQVSDKVVENSFKWKEIYPILHLTAVVSIALGLTNLLPLPALDGGRIAFVLLELLRGKPVNVKREKLIHAAGMVGLLGLMVMLVVQDVVNPLFK